MVFKFVSFVEFTKRYQPTKFQFCGLSGSNCTEGLQKHNDDVIMTSFHNFRIQFYFAKLVISYQRTNFEIPQLSQSNFTEVFIRHPKKPL